MSNNVPLGTNHTGIQTSPIDSTRLIDFANHTPPDIPGDEHTLAEARKAYIEEAELIGSVPPPGTIKGVLGTLIKKLTGNNLEVLVDKLAERIAFERTGTRLYDALIAKVETFSDAPSDLLQDLRQFRNEELEHFNIVVNATEALGADPTAQTPCADTVGTASLGLIQVITDPRTNLAQSLNALLTAELTDNAGWELLIGLCKQLGLEKIADHFQQPLVQEKYHLSTIKTWLEKITIKEAS
jgi:rubrerythrin